jgi:hypothetical protein
VKRTEFHAILLGFCNYFWNWSRNARALAAFQNKPVTLGRKGFGPFAAGNGMSPVGPEQTEEDADTAERAVAMIGT